MVKRSSSPADPMPSERRKESLIDGALPGNASNAVGIETETGSATLVNGTQPNDESGRRNNRPGRLPVQETSGAEAGAEPDPDRALGIWPAEVWKLRLQQAYADAIAHVPEPDREAESEGASIEPPLPEAGVDLEIKTARPRRFKLAAQDSDLAGETEPETVVFPQRADPAAPVQEGIEAAFDLFGAVTGVSLELEEAVDPTKRQLFYDHQVQGGIGMLEAARQVALQLGSPGTAVGYGIAADAIQAAFEVPEGPADLNLMPGSLVKARADRALEALQELISRSGQPGQGPFLRGMQDFVGRMQEGLAAGDQQDCGSVAFGSVKRFLSGMMEESSTAAENGRPRSFLAGRAEAARVFGAALGIESGEPARPLTHEGVSPLDFLGPLQVSATETDGFSQARGVKALAERAGSPYSDLSPAEAGRHIRKLLAQSEAPEAMAAQETYNRHLWNETGAWLGRAMQHYPAALSPAMAAYNTLPGGGIDDWTTLVRCLEQVPQDQVPTGLETQRRQVVSGLRHIFDLPENPEPPPRESQLPLTRRERFMAQALQDGGDVLQELRPLVDRANSDQVVAALLECQVDISDIGELVGDGGDGPAFWAAAEMILLEKVPSAYKEMIDVRDENPGLPEPVLREAWVRRFLELQRFFLGQSDLNQPVRWKQVLAPYQPAATQEVDERQQKVASWIMEAFNYWQGSFPSYSGDAACRMLYNQFVLGSGSYRAAGLDRGQAAAALEELVKRVTKKSGQR